MKTIKANILAVIAFFSAIIGGLLFYISRKNKESSHLKADKDLTVQNEESKEVDMKVEKAQVKIDELHAEMKSPVKGDDDFWDEYTKGKK